MNYEQKYKEALAWMRDLYPGLHGATKEDAEHYFPELRESEDERIRKFLIDILNHGTWKKGWPFSPPECISWLEKLKEQKVDIDKLRKDIYQSGYNDGYQHGREDKQKEQKPIPSRETILGIWELGNIWKENPEERDGLTQLQYIQKHWFEKCDYQKEQKPRAENGVPPLDFYQGIMAGRSDVIDHPEQFGLCKPAEWNEEEIKLLDSIIDDYEKASKSFCGYDGKILVLKAIRDGEYNLPKSAWSEKDYDMLNNITIAAKFGKKCKPEEIHWLQELPERINFQPKQEWSEEDEKMRIGLISLVKEIKMRPLKRLEDWDGYIHFLESIHPQPKQLKESYKEGFQTARNAIALAFMKYCDKIRPNGKMCLSNSECEEIEKAFLVGDWEKIERYFHKYSWKPNEEQMEALKETISQDCTVCNGDRKWIKPNLESLYEQLKAL